MRTYDCAPTLTDSQVLDFCRTGFLMLEGVVPDEINRISFDYLEEHPEHTPIQILEEDWFVDNVILNPHAAGAIRSVLGRDFALTMPYMANHRVQCPETAQGWHRDKGSVFSHELDSLQVFYYPQDTPLELGPTEVVPGSHFRYADGSAMSHYGSIRNAVSTTAPAGSIFLTVYSIWHRRTISTASGTRNLLKYWYMRTVPPDRDWIIEPEFELEHAYHVSVSDTAEMFYWLCGMHSEFRARTNNLPAYYYEARKLCKFCGYRIG